MRRRLIALKCKYESESAFCFYVLFINEPRGSKLFIILGWAKFFKVGVWDCDGLKKTSRKTFSFNFWLD